MPSYQVKQSSTAYPLVFLMVDSTDHVSAKTGLSPTVTISKAGGSFASPSGAVTEIGSGWYKVAGNATDSGTLGPLALHATATGADPTDSLYEVVAHDVQDAVHLGLSCLPNTAVTTNGSLLTSGTGTAQISVSSGQVLLQTGTGTGQLDFTSGVVKANLVQIIATALSESSVGQIALAFKKWFNVLAPTGTVNSIPDAVAGAASGLAIVGSNMGTVSSVTGNVSGNVVGSVGSVTGLTASNLDATVSSRLPTSSYTAPDNSTIAAIAGYVDTEVAAIKAKTDLIPAAPAAVGDIPTAAQNAAALLDLSNGIETSITPRQAMRLILAASAGKLSGAATTTITIRNVGDSKDRITATVDSSGNRTAVTTDGT